MERLTAKIGEAANRQDDNGQGGSFLDNADLKNSIDLLTTRMDQLTTAVQHISAPSIADAIETNSRRVSLDDADRRELRELLNELEPHHQRQEKWEGDRQKNAGDSEIPESGLFCRKS